MTANLKNLLEEKTVGVAEDPAATQSISLIENERSIVVRSKTNTPVDTGIVKYEYYNSFNYSLLAEQKGNIKLTLGITSPNEGEGKTLTASNLAVSLTLGSRKKTVIVDMNLQQPRLHEIFGTERGPGLIEALRGDPINIAPTKIDNLYLLSAGSAPRRSVKQNPIGLEYTSAFGEVLYALEREFDFIIVDMPAIKKHEFPILFVNHLNGLLVVVELGKTKRRDIDQIFRQFNKNQVLGFVFNRVTDND